MVAMRESTSSRANQMWMTALLCAFACLTAAGTAVAQQEARVFTIAKYPVEATGTNAVAAKREATAKGRQAAFRSLLKRIVPASSYSMTEQLAKQDPQQFIRSVRVRSEENSSTQYIATLDFSFDPVAVRSLLSQHRLPFVDQQAPPTSLLLLYAPPQAGGSSEMTGNKGGASWRSVWADLDLENSLAPMSLVRQPNSLTPDVVKALLAADPAAISSLGAQYRTAQLVIAEAHPLPGSNELKVTLAGQDAVGRFSVATRYRLDDEDFTYSLELAAVIAQGVLEGRWKTLKTAPQAASGGGAVAALQVLAEFNNLGQWQRQQQALANTPGVRNMQIGGLSGRSARISLAYPGGGTALQAALGQQGLRLENINGFWILR